MRFEIVGFRSRSLFWLLAAGPMVAGHGVSAVEVDPSTAAAGPVAGVVATVNGTPVYLEDLESTLGSLHSGAEESQRGDFDPSQLLERVVDDILLAEEARALGMAEEEPIPGRLEQLRTGLAVARLEQVEIEDRVVVTDEDVRGNFGRNYRTATIRLVTLAEKEEAEAVLAEIDLETDFESLARERSVDQYSARGGLIEEIARIDLPMSLGAAIFQAESGQVIGPVETRMGWALVRIDSLADADPERFAGVEKRIRQIIGFGRAEESRRRLAIELRERYSVLIDQEALNAIRCERLPDGRLSPGIDDPNAVVVTLKDREIRAGTMAQALLKRWAGVKDERAALAVKPVVLDRLIRAELFEVEALARGYGDGPEVVRRLEASETRMLVSRYLREIVAPQIAVSEEEQRAYYEEHHDKYRRPPRVHVRQVTVVGLEEAEQVAELLREGTDIGWLAREHSIDRFKDSAGTRGWMEPIQGLDPFSDALFVAQAGDVIGPMGPEGNRMVLQVDAREDQGYLAFEQVASNIDQSVARQKFVERRAEVLALLRSRSEIVIYEEVMDTLRILGSRQDEAAAAESVH